MKLFNVILIVYSLLIGSVFGATITDDTVKIGKPGSSANKEITLGTSKKIRANESTGKLEFSNDGVLYKNLGSGSGSGGSTGTNLIVNDSFEDGIGSPWTSSGGTFTQETYAVGFEGNTKYARFVASGAGQYVEQIVSVPTSFSGGCQADFKKVSVSTAGLFKVQALDASDNVLAEQTIGVSSWVKVPTISFPCPSAGSNNLKLRMTSISAGAIDFDLGYIGSNQNLVYSSQARLVGTMTVNNCASGWTTSSTTLASFPAQTGCTYSVSGSLLAPLTNIPAFRVARLEAGDYWIEYQGSFNQSTASKSGWLRFTDGTNIARETSAVYSAGGLISVPGISQSISYATPQSNVTMELKGYTESGGSTTVFGVITTPAVFKLWFFPSSSEVAVSNEQSSWFIDANIGGQNPNLGTGSVSSYTEIAGTTLDLVINTEKGSANAEIPCASGTASTGLTCPSANESVGIAFVPPHAGLFEACFSFTHNANSTNGGTSYFQIVETSSTALTILTEGGQRIGAGHGNSISTINGQKVCGRFNFSDTSKKTLRLYYEQNVSSGTAFSILADRSANDGQRDIHVSVVPLLQSHGRPILTSDQITTPGFNNGKIYSAFVNSIGAVSREKGDLINGSCTMSGANSATFSCPTTKFTSSPHCSCTVSDGVVSAANFYCQYLSTSSATSLKFFTTANGELSARNISISCHGE